MLRAILQLDDRDGRQRESDPEPNLSVLAASDWTGTLSRSLYSLRASKKAKRGGSAGAWSPGPAAEPVPESGGRVNSTAAA